MRRVVLSILLFCAPTSAFALTPEVRVRRPLRPQEVMSSSLRQARAGLKRLFSGRLPEQVRPRKVILRGIRLNRRERAEVEAPHGFTSVSAKGWSFAPGYVDRQTGIPDLILKQELKGIFFTTSWGVTHREVVLQRRHERSHGSRARVSTRAVAVLPSGSFIEKADYYGRRSEPEQLGASTRTTTATRFYQHHQGRRTSISQERYHKLLQRAIPLKRLANPNLSPPHP